MNNYTESTPKWILGTNGSPLAHQIFSGRGELVTITVLGAVASPFVVYDGGAVTTYHLYNSGSTVVSAPASLASGTYTFNATIVNGLDVTTYGANNLTITYRTY